MVRKVSYPVYDEIREHHRPQGGTQTLCISGMGKGKTTWLLHRLRDQLKRGEVCIWRGRETAQWTPFLGKEKVKFWTRKWDSYTFIKVLGDSLDGVEVSTEELGIEVETFESHQDLIRRCKPEVVNIVYVLPSDPSNWKEKQACVKWWLKFFQALIRRTDNRWISFFVDEFDDIVQEYPKGEFFFLQQDLKDNWPALWQRTRRHGYNQKLDLYNNAQNAVRRIWAARNDTADEIGQHVRVTRGTPA